MRYSNKDRIMEKKCIPMIALVYFCNHYLLITTHHILVYKVIDFLIICFVSVYEVPFSKA